MPRSDRIIVPDTPHHVMQRGHNRQAVFISDEDYTYYRDNLLLFKQEFGCKVYAYCLMTNHVHLIVDPGPDPESLSKLMKRVAGRQTRYVNKSEKRSGSIWEGRFKSSIISTHEYLPACCRYIELNPLRAGMVDDPAEYRWSSYACKVRDTHDPVVDFPRFYLALGADFEERRAAYRKYVLDTIPDNEINLIRKALQRGQITGGNRFREELSTRLGMRFSNLGPGRPKVVKN
ncbi:REP-associated tyrosine transposase [Desulfogranum japonicum]|uniref:REP-associated tyrosine transposase n=1 Tax=Desulfogranum japonicum TaxID=231447 RepID=UPI000491515A